jgi:hypothetical protein
MTPPETSPFCALVKTRDQCWAFGVRRAYGRHGHKCHLAFAVTLPELLAAGKRLNDLGVLTRNFAGNKTVEPSVIGWMLSAQLYFDDPAGHSLEFIALLDDKPDPGFIGPLSVWQKRNLVHAEKQ